MYKEGKGTPFLVPAPLTVKKKGRHREREAEKERPTIEMSKRKVQKEILVHVFSPLDC